MKSKNILILIVVIVALVVVFYGFEESQDDTTYIETINKERERTDRFMRTSKESPFANNKDAFTGLKYFPPDVAYRINAKLEPIEEKKVMLLPTNDGTEQRYIPYGYAVFEHSGVQNRLLILEGIGMGPVRGKVFIPFGDETSALQTYGGGRYLDVNKVPGSVTVVLDFNKAYNPYCAYNETYSCPLPPAENLLKIPILAGEKSYH